MTAVPAAHVKDANSLSGDAYVELFEIRLYPSGVMYLCPTGKITWQGNTYEHWGLTLTGEATSSDDQTSRPKLSLANFTQDANGDPVEGVFSALNGQNAIEGATVIRREVLRSNIDTNTNIKVEKRWRVARIASERPAIVVLELRNTLDGPRFVIPARKFLPPEFSQVKLN